MGTRNRRLTGWRLTAALVLAAIVIFPIYWMFVTSVSTPEELYARDAPLWPVALHPENYTEPLARYPFARWFANSTVIAVVSVVATVVVNLMAGYAFAKLEFPLKNVLFLAIISTLMVPVQVIMVAQFQVVVELDLVNTNWGVILPRLAEAFGLFLSRQFMAAVPDELLEAASLDGAGQLRRFVSVVLPLCKPLVATLVIFTFMWRWNEFAWPLIVLRDNDSYTLPVGLLFLQSQFGNDVGGLMAMSMLATIPMLVVFAVFQRFFVEGMARSGIK
ncbi:MAG TPA: carbohydrate ABC transporter permease [Pseudonocardia sp.]|jgi:ABC-type glycerol-3-phosphate transport system permease component|nr:carbohydrate ABC transporter permease [Pseudonocardia sp.]